MILDGLIPNGISLNVAIAICAIALVSGTARGFSGFGSALIFMPLASSIAAPRLVAALLLVIDFVQAYLQPGSPLYAGVEAAQAAAITLLQAARAANIPVLHTNVVYQRGGRDGGVFFRKVPALRCFEAGAQPELAAFAAGLEPIAGETVISKQYASAFENQGDTRNEITLVCHEMRVCKRGRQLMQAVM